MVFITIYEFIWASRCDFDYRTSVDHLELANLKSTFFLRRDDQGEPCKSQYLNSVNPCRGYMNSRVWYYYFKAMCMASFFGEADTFKYCVTPLLSTHNTDT